MRNKAVSFSVKVAMFSALSIVLYFISFPLPIFASFLKIQFSNLPAYLAGFALNPWGGMLVVMIRFLIKLTEELREAIKDDKILEYREEFLSKYFGD